MPDLRARPLTPQGLSNLLDRKPHLLRPLALQLLPPPAFVDPATRLGVDLSALRTADDLRQVASAVLAAVGRGGIAPAQGVRLVRRGRGCARCGAPHDWKNGRG